MRVRSTDYGVENNTTHHYYWHTNDGGGIHEIGNVNWSNCLGGETIVDDEKWRTLKTPYGRKVLTMKPCSHTTWGTNCPNTSVSVRIDTSFAWASVAGGAILRTWDITDSGYHLLAKCQATEGSYNTGHYDRWAATLPTMGTRANMAVFLAELRDIRRMIDLIPKHFQKNTNLWKALSGNWHNILKFANNFHLNYNFGWKPFIRDIIKACEAVSSFEDRLLRFIRQSNQDLRKHKRSDDVVLDTTVIEGPWVNWWRKEWKITGTIKRSSTFDYAYTLPSTFSFQDLRRRAWMDSFGLNLSAANIAAIIPWSFVLAWFVNYDRLLNRWLGDGAWLSPEVLFTQACYVHNAEISIELTILNSPSVGSQRVPVGTINYKNFQRGVGIPNFDFSTNPLDANKIRLLASLALSRIL